MTSESSHPPDDPASALSHIEDDEAETLAAQYWAMDQLLDGAMPEEVRDDLVEQGWNVDRAEEIAEQARKLTRCQRGVVTRDDVARGAHAKYRRGQRRTAILIRLVLFAVAMLVIWVVIKTNFFRPRP